MAVVNVGEDGVEAGGRDAPVGEGVLRVVDVCEGDALREDEGFADAIGALGGGFRMGPGHATRR